MKEWKKPQIENLGFTETNEVRGTFICGCGAVLSNNGWNEDGLKHHQKYHCPLSKTEQCPNETIS